jgi:hypothetical protein
MRTGFALPAAETSGLRRVDLMMAWRLLKALRPEEQL